MNNQWVPGTLVLQSLSGFTTPEVQLARTLKDLIGIAEIQETPGAVRFSKIPAGASLLSENIYKVPRKNSHANLEITVFAQLFLL